jgi:RuvB-like protein 1 (pontin 52)
MMTNRCLIIKTETYNVEQIQKVIALRAAIEGLTLGPGVLDKLAREGEKASLRSVAVLMS